MDERAREMEEGPSAGSATKETVVIQKFGGQAVKYQANRINRETGKCLSVNCDRLEPN